MAYESRLRRRTRAIARLAAASARRDAWPRTSVVPAFWWDGHPNFGDALTPWLLARHGVTAIHTSPERAWMCGVGSIIEHLPGDFSGVIWGSGLMHDRPCALPGARVAALRGHLTKERLGVHDDVALGDPGMLVSRHVHRPTVTSELGLVPHGMHLGHEVFAQFAGLQKDQGRMIDPRRSVSHVVREIARCRAVVTTSLHGLIVADSFGIPALWAALDPPVFGGEFKFHDYESVMTPGRTRQQPLRLGVSTSDLLAGVDTADAGQRDACIAQLEASIDLLPSVLERPYLAWKHRSPDCQRF